MKKEKLKKFFASKGVKSAVLITAVLLVGLAVYLNYRWFYDPIDSLGFGKNNMEDNYSDSAETDAEAKNNYIANGYSLMELLTK